MWATRASLVLIFFEMIPLGSTAALVLRPQFITTEVQKQAGAVILKTESPGDGACQNCLLYLQTRKDAVSPSLSSV